MIGVTVLVFTILYFSPGDPAYLALGDNATPEAVEAYRIEMGINGTYWERLGRTLMGLLQGDLGLSYRSRTPVLDELIVRFKVTFNISAWSILLGILLGIFFGIVSALKQNTVWDSLATGCALFGISMPMFWQGLMLMLWRYWSGQRTRQAWHSRFRMIYWMLLGRWKSWEKQPDLTQKTRRLLTYRYMEKKRQENRQSY